MSLADLGIQKPTAPTRGFGRVRLPNPGSLNFPLSAALPKRALSSAAWKSKRWQLGKGLHFLDQSAADRPDTSEDTCVKYGNTHILMLTPIIRADALAITTSKNDLGVSLYPWAQANDPWPGAEPEYYGTSVDAGLQFLLKVAKVISEYRWARSMDEVLGRLCISAKEGGGPLVGGSDFYSDMANRNGDGIWHPTGEIWGGHCYCTIGYQKATAKKSAMMILGNSHDGNHVGYMPADEYEWLHFAQGGELAAVTELARAA
jgi:hypothetical protein